MSQSVSKCKLPTSLFPGGFMAVSALTAIESNADIQACCIHQTPVVLQHIMHLFTCPSHSHMYRDCLQACELLCLCSRKSARQVSVIKHPKPSPQGSHADQNTPANFATSKTAALLSRPLSNSGLAPASHTGADQSISPAVVPDHHASAQWLPQQTAAAPGHDAEGSNWLPAVEGSDLPPAASTSLSTKAQRMQEQRTSALCAWEHLSRQPFMVIHADTSVPTTAPLGKAADPPSEKPAQHAAQQQLPAPIEIQQPQAPMNTLAQQHVEVAHRSEGSSVNDQCSSSGSFDRPATSQEVGHVRHMRNPVSSGSLDTAASSSSNAAAAAAATAAVAQAAGTSQASARDATRLQPSSTAAQSDGISNGVTDGSPTGSKGTAASSPKSRAGLVDDAPCRDTGISGKPSSRVRAGAVAAGRQKKSKGASTEVSRWWLSTCLRLSVACHIFRLS